MNYIKGMAGKRGKTKGATSFITVSLGTLNNILREGAVVMCSRRWAETLGIEGENCSGNLKRIQDVGGGSQGKTKIHVEKHDLEEDGSIEVKKSVDF